jgi:hypothetical protein
MTVFTGTDLVAAPAIGVVVGVGCAAVAHDITKSSAMPPVPCDHSHERRAFSMSTIIAVWPCKGV